MHDELPIDNDINIDSIVMVGNLRLSSPKSSSISSSKNTLVSNSKSNTSKKLIKQDDSPLKLENNNHQNIENDVKFPPVKTTKVSPYWKN